MADFEAPSGPPPPKVPEGWIARWNDQYKEWFYINKYTKKSQWDRPTEPVYPPNEDGDAPPGPPPAYRPGDGPAPTDTKTNPFAHSATSTPNPHGAGPSGADDEDARLARQLQAEEDAKARGSTPGSANSYLNSPTPPSSNSSAYPEQLPPRPGDNKDRSLFGKIFGKNKQQGQPGYAPQQPQYGYQNRPPQQYGYGPPPPQQYGYGPPPGQYYQGPPPGGYYQQGYAPQQQYGRPSGGGGGMGMMGGAALGLGAGLIGGALIENAIDNHDEQVYDQGYNAGADDGGGGGDFDGGGGDF